MTHNWEYRGKKVQVAWTADIPTEYREGSRRGLIIQEILDGIKPWQEGDNPIETVIDMDPMPQIVVPIGRRRIRWARHIGHKAQAVGLSPFVISRPQPTQSFTVEMAGSIDSPLLVRAYPGEYTPPLPWQQSAKDADGGMEACVAFWRRHAYIYRLSRIVTGSETSVAPSWFTK